MKTMIRIKYIVSKVKIKEYKLKKCKTREELEKNILKVRNNTKKKKNSIIHENIMLAAVKLNKTIKAGSTKLKWLMDNYKKKHNQWNYIKKIGI